MLFDSIHVAFFKKVDVVMYNFYMYFSVDSDIDMHDNYIHCWSCPLFVSFTVA